MGKSMLIAFIFTLLIFAEFSLSEEGSKLYICIYYIIAIIYPHVLSTG